MNVTFRRALLSDVFDDLFGPLTTDALLLPLEVARKAPSRVKKVEQKDGSINVIMEVPGFEKEQLKVKIVDGILQVSGERDDGTKVWLEEFVGRNVNTSAKLKNGLLTINILQDKREVEVKIE